MRQAIHRPAANASARGFTLVEVLMAVAVGGLLLVTAVSFAMSMGELWGNGSETRLFDQHVRGVSRFLENILRQAEPPPPPEAEGGADAAAQDAQGEAQARRSGFVPQESDPPVVWQAPRGRDFAGLEFLTFELAESPGVLAWPEHPLPYVVCALRVDPREGLFLQWKSRLELDFEDATPREMLVSPFVTDIAYLYYDSAGPTPRWDERDRPLTGDGNVLEVPQRVRLTFEYEGDSRAVDLIIPGTASGVPVY